MDGRERDEPEGDVPEVVAGLQRFVDAFDVRVFTLAGAA